MTLSRRARYHARAVQEERRWCPVRPGTRIDTRATPKPPATRSRGHAGPECRGIRVRFERAAVRAWPGVPWFGRPAAQARVAFAAHGSPRPSTAGRVRRSFRHWRSVLRASRAGSPPTAPPTTTPGVGQMSLVAAPLPVGRPVPPTAGRRSAASRTRCGVAMPTGRREATPVCQSFPTQADEMAVVPGVGRVVRRTGLINRG